MRSVLIDWLVQVQVKFKLLQDTLYMSVAIIDCFLQVSVSAMCQEIPSSLSKSTAQTALICNTITDM